MIRILLSTRLGERRWSQADLARATGIRPSTINDLYHEIAERVNLEHLDFICEASGQTRQNLSNKMTRGNFTEKDITELAAALGCTVEIRFVTQDGEEI